MVDLETFYKNVHVFMDESHPLGQRIKFLLDEVIQGLPDEEQFQMKGQIAFYQREAAVEFWKQLRPQLGFGPDLLPTNRDGNCIYQFGPTIQDSFFIITIIIDNLESHSDDYIKGLITHELSEMSLHWNATQKEMSSLIRMKPKARQIKMDQITKQNAEPGSKEYDESEKNVNDEARRLGFQKEIDELENYS